VAKVRVHELAKELGQPSKVVLQKLQDMGEFVRSASSTIEAPVARRLRDQFPGSSNQSAGSPAKASAPAAPKPGQKPATPKPGAAKPTPAPEQPAEQKPDRSSAADTQRPAASAKPGGAPKPGQTPAPRQAPAAETPAAPERPAAQERSSAPKPGQAGPRPGGAPRPGNNPFATSQGMPRPGQRRQGGGQGGPRPGNNPFATSQGMPRPGAPRPQRDGQNAGGSREGGARPAAPRPGGRPGMPTPGVMRQHAHGGIQDARQGGTRQGGGARPGPGGRGGGRPGAPGGAPGGGGGFPGGGRPGGGGRGGRGGTQGAFGRGGKPARSRKSKRAKRQEFEQMQAPAPGGVSIPRGNGQTVRLRRGASLTDFADRIDVNPASLITVLFAMGEMATATQSLDEDTFHLLGEELGYRIEIVSPEDEERELLGQFDIDLDAELADEDDEDRLPRPPVVTVMGHVDHGKTRLLDTIRNAHVQAGEAGGITQHIGAYQVVVEHEGEEGPEERPITFIDTPGHEAFTAMRARGADVTDIAILVVAADDGVMPQTVEALNHAQAADVPIVVAVNKIDKPDANPQKIRQQLTEFNLVAEEYGGDTMFVDVSARENLNIDQLLEAVLLTADAALDLRANPDKDARGVAIEANLDRGRGPVATVLVQQGTLHVGDAIVCGTGHGRVRAMLDEHGQQLQEAGPSRPVQVLGLTSVPGAGDSFLVAQDERTARQIAEKREAANRAALLSRTRKRISLEDINKAMAEGKVETLNLILKGDAAGSVEALEEALLGIEIDDQVQLRIIDRGVGAITMNNINLAVASDAVIIGFNVRAEGQNAEYADREGVEIKYYSVIYRAIEEVEQALQGMLKPEYEEVDTGSAEIRDIFRSSKFGNIAGSIVRSGTIRRGAKARITRRGVVITENLEIAGLRRFKDDVTEVREGFECGINLGSFNDLQLEDLITTYEMREKPRETK